MDIIFQCIRNGLMWAAESPPVAPPAPTGPATSPADEIIKMLGLIVPMGLVFYLFILRPESKRRKQREQTLNTLKSKDKVITVGGLHGTVVDIDKDEVVLLVDPKKEVRLRFRRSAIDTIESTSVEEKK